MIVVGFGFSARATKHSLASALAIALQSAIAQRVAIHAFACPASKISTPAFCVFAHENGLPLLGIADDRLRLQTTWTRSTKSLAAFGVGSVAEASAVAGAQLLWGEDFSPTLRGCRVKSSDGLATAAVASLCEVLTL